MKVICAATFLATYLMLPQWASAGCYSDADILGFPKIGVVGNGVEYTHVDAVGYGWNGKIDVECGVFGRVKSWAMWPEVHIEGIGSLSFYEYRASDTYAFGKRPKEVHRSEGHIFPNVFVKTYAVAACNLHANLMREDGISDAVIFSKDHIIALQYRANYDVDVTSTLKNVQEASGIGFSEVICREWEGLRNGGPDDLTADTEFELLGASLILFPKRFEGACPKEMSLFVRVDGNVNGSVEVWIESSAGWTSDEGVLETSEFDQVSGDWFGQIDERLAVPILLPTPPPSGQVVPPSPATDLILPPNDPGVNGFPPGPDWSPDLSIEGPAGNVHAASLRLTARVGEQTISSDWQSYSYTCDPKSAIDPPTDDRIAPDEAPREGVTMEDLTGE